MKYELALRLKNAGFPQGDSFENVIASGVAMAYLRESKPDDVLLEKYETALKELRAMYEDDKEWVYQPTLEQLIDACGGVLLWGCNDHGYYASKQFCPSEYKTLESTFGGAIEADSKGSTPSEAVANLWLALNKKDG